VSTDSAGDVVSFPVSGAGVPAATPAPERVLGDILGSSVTHRRRNVVLQLRYRELDATGAAGGHLFVIRTSRTQRLVTVYTGAGFWDGRVQVEDARGKVVRCRVGRRIDYTANTATVVVPRSCLGKPSWVRVGMAGLTFDSLDSVFADDARTHGGLGANPALGPRVRR
jgi:hypothetical protein